MNNLGTFVALAEGGRLFGLDLQLLLDAAITAVNVFKMCIRDRYIVLPAARQTAGKNETSESRQEENQTAQADSTKRTVVLDSGHGGFDPGKESSDGILEKHINLAIAERLKLSLIHIFTGYS